MADPDASKEVKRQGNLASGKEPDQNTQYLIKYKQTHNNNNNNKLNERKNTPKATADLNKKSFTIN